MKKLLAILVLGLFLITPSQADDIRDFQIEGMSIYDSLLNYYNEDQLKQDILPIVDALDQKQNEWKKSVNESLSVYDFLKENFYETS